MEFSGESVFVIYVINLYSTVSSTWKMSINDALKLTTVSIQITEDFEKIT